MRINLNKIMNKGKAMYLAYDQGLEHGPTEFNEKNVDPNFIISIAKKGKYNAVIFQKGIAQKYQKEIKESKVPLIVKLNGHTNLYSGEPMSEQLCTVDEAVALGAKAVGYTIYVGSKYENRMLKEFENIQREAHNLGIPVIAWIYPRGKSVEGKDEGELMAYAARVALEIGADIAKIRYNGNPKDLKWAVKSAERVKVVIAGGIKTSEKLFLKEAKDIIDSGGSGVAVGRNMWKSSDPLKLSKELRKIIF